LNCDFNIVEKVLDNDIYQFKIIVYGDKKTHQMRYGEGSWKRLLNNLEQLSFSCYQNIVIEVYNVKNINKKDLHEILKYKEKFKIILESAYPFSYESFLNYIKHKKKDKYIEILDLDVKKYIKMANNYKNKPCVSQRVFPVIKSDMSVNCCHLFYSFTICDNYLNVSWEELVKIRAKNEFCKICQNYALHRLDLHLLKKD